MYTGLWLEPTQVARDIKVGDLIMFETLDGVVVEEVYEVKQGELWYFNGCVRTFPTDQIVAVKQK